MKRILPLLLLLAIAAAHAKQRPIAREAQNVSVDEEPYCRSLTHCVKVSRVPNNPKLFTVQIFGRDSILVDKMTCYSTGARKITARDVEKLLDSGIAVMHGDYWGYSAKGELLRHFYFQNGLRDSLNYTYFPGEGNYLVSRYEFGKKGGIEQEYRYGGLASEIKYFEGKPDGVRVVFDGKDRVIGTIDYDTLGRKTEATEYYLSGGVKRLERYGSDSLRTDTLISAELFAEDGQPLEPDGLLVERRPRFNADPDSLTRYLFANVVYPYDARMIELEAIVKVAAEIDTLGNVLNPEVVSTTANPEFFYEAVRVVKNMPRWTPGVRYWRTSRERVVVSVPFFMNYTLNKPVSVFDYWKKVKEQEKLPKEQEKSPEEIKEEPQIPTVLQEPPLPPEESQPPTDIALPAPDGVPLPEIPE